MDEELKKAAEDFVKDFANRIFYETDVDDEIDLSEQVKRTFIAGAEWKDRSLNWIRDLVKAAIKKPEEAQGILERIDRMLNKEDEK